MASIYKPKDKQNWYISYVDPDTGKAKNKSTGLLATPENKKILLEKTKVIEKLIKDKKLETLNANLIQGTIKTAFDHFKKINHDKSSKTKYGYDFFYDLFTQVFKESNPCTVITKRTAEDWIIQIKQMDKQPNTIFNYFKVFNKFLNFLFEYSYIAPFVINKGLRPKPEVKEITIFTDEHFKLIFEKMCELKKTNNFQIAIYLLGYTGLRPSDILEVKVENIDLKKNILSYYSPKTKQYLAVPIHQKLLPKLKERITEVGSGRLINYITIGEMGKAFRRYLNKIELDKLGYNLRTFRKHFATKAFENDIQLMSAAKLLGHSNISTTMKYYTKANTKKLGEDLDKIDL